jgi:hypothetical protein
MPENNNLPEKVSETTPQKSAAEVSADKTNYTTNSFYQSRALLEGGST